MTPINPQASASNATASTNSDEATRAGQSAVRPPQLTDVIHMQHISEEILPTLTLKQASLLAGSSRELGQIINSAFANTLPEIKQELNKASPAVRNFFKPIKLGSPGNLENIRARMNASNLDIHPALRAHANRINRLNAVHRAATTPSPMRNVIQNPD